MKLTKSNRVNKLHLVMTETKRIDLIAVNMKMFELDFYIWKQLIMSKPHDVYSESLKN